MGSRRFIGCAEYLFFSRLHWPFDKRFRSSLIPRGSFSRGGVNRILTALLLATLIFVPILSVLPERDVVSADSPVTPMVSAGLRHTVGLKSDGTVVAVGDNRAGQCNVGSWTGIQQVATGQNWTVGLKSDGTVVAVGASYYGECNVGSWTGIQQVAAGLFHTVGLKSDGTVVITGSCGYCDVGSWIDIQQVAAGYDYTVGLKSDGTAVATGDDSMMTQVGWGTGRLNVGSWTDICQVAAGKYHTVGLKSNGTVVVTGYNDDGECNVGSWTDICQVAAGDDDTVGLKSDGTVVAVGYNDQGQCNVGSWTDIQQVDAGAWHTVGLKSDGTVVAVGYNDQGQCNTFNWNLGVTISNHPPNQPTNLSPIGSGVSLTATLQASAFSDPDAEDSLAVSQWEITTTEGDYLAPLFGFSSITGLPTLPVPSGTLTYDTTYYWHVRYQDNHGAWSTWSAETTFITGNAPQLVNLDVPFKAQVPPGSWAETNNCGQTSSLMVFSYWNGTVPTEQGIKDIDDWLYTKYGDPVNGYNGSISTTTKLESLAREYGGFSTYKASGWDLNRLKRELDAGHPVIVAVIAGRLSNRSYTYSGGHFVVVKGYSSTHVICNDPGTSGGHDKYYANTEFSLAMSDQGGSVVVIAPPPTADFSADPVYAIEDQVVHFTGLPSGGILPYSYAWDFGDGTTANDQNPSHAYSAPGSYPVSLTITDSTSATTSKTKHVTVWGVKKYAPTLRFDDKENYYPTDVHGDDGDVTNNHENWDAGKFGSTRVCYYNVVTYPDSVVYEYWYYYANNAFPLDNHEHDFEAAFVWVNNATNKPFYFGLTQHQWINESEISDTSQLVAYVELGGHGMADSSLPISGEGDGTAISGNNFTYQPMSAAESFAGADLDDAGNYKTNEFSISHVKAPWQRADYANPEGEIRLTEGLGQTNWITIKLHSPGELRVLDSQDRTTGIVGGETRNEIPNSTYYGDAVTILSPVDSYRYEVVGTGQGSYGLTVTLVKDTGPVTFAATDIPILANGVHQYTIDWDALSLGQQGATIAIDSNGDGTVDNSLSADAELTHEEFLSATSEQGLPSWIWIVVGVAAAVGVGVVAYLVSSRRAPKQG